MSFTFGVSLGLLDQLGQLPATVPPRHPYARGQFRAVDLLARGPGRLTSEGETPADPAANDKLRQGPTQSCPEQVTPFTGSNR